MELKWGWAPYKLDANKVLIAPLWNWNSGCPDTPRSHTSVLIVPLWNWNWPIAYGERGLYCVLIVPLWNWYGKYHRCIANSSDKKSELFLVGADSLYFPQSLEVQCPFYFTFTIFLPALAKKLSIVFLLNLLYRSLCFSYHTIMSEYSELIPTFKSIKESARQLGLEFDVE